MSHRATPRHTQCGQRRVQIMPEINFELTAQQGPLKAGFKVHLEGKYIVLVGANNSAKTSLLQAIFKKYAPASNLQQPKTETCLILPERIYVDTTVQPGGNTLETYNYQLASTIGFLNRSYRTWVLEPASSELPKLLL